MKKQPLLRVVCLFLAAISGFNLLSGIACWLIADVFGGLSFNVTKASTIGIIGGSDGPTAIFVTATHPHIGEFLLWLGLLTIAIYGLRCFWKGK